MIKVTIGHIVKLMKNIHRNECDDVGLGRFDFIIGIVLTFLQRYDFAIGLNPEGA